MVMSSVIGYLAGSIRGNFDTLDRQILCATLQSTEKVRIQYG